ncbi:MAG TPA: glutathione-disulfide reductase [Aestuariivirgaceae bacterium]|nr:glutathione-disulfide reductase [Aestuariivirgaceae bacterium]
MAYDYDLFIIGAGSGGVRAARIAAQHGARVAIAEEDRVGGTCVIRGCIPKKLFVYASSFREAFEDAAGYGWTVGKPAFDWPTLMANKDREIDRLNKVYIRNLEAAGANLLPVRAELEDAHTVRLGDGGKVTAETILIATGALPSLNLAVPGDHLAITSNEAFHLPELPRRIVIAGGGYIAVEFAGIFNGLGVETTLVYRRGMIMRGFDDDLRAALTEELTKKGIRIVTDTVFTRLDRTGDGIAVTLTSGEVLNVDQAMAAIGRYPNTNGLGLEKVGVACNEVGAVKVDSLSMSSIDNIYAIGDVTDRVNLTPVAIREGHAFADTVYGGRLTKVDHEDIPTAVFSQPEMGTVGLTEAAARTRYAKVDVYKSQFRPLKHTLTGRDEKMLMKLVVDGESTRVLGCHVLGPDAGEMAQLVGIAIKMGATKADFDATMAVHPTAAEELVTMRHKSEPGG